MVCVCVFFFFFVLVEMCIQKMKKKKSAETVGVGWWNPTVRAEPVIDNQPGLIGNGPFVAQYVEKLNRMMWCHVIVLIRINNINNRTGSGEFVEQKLEKNK